MTKRLLFRKQLGGLKPAEPAAQEWLAKIKGNQDLWLTPPTRARNPDWHRKYMKMLSIVYENLPEELTEHYPTFDRFRKSVMVGIGRYDTWRTRKGDVLLEPHSLAFDRMDQDEFEAVWEDTIKVLLTHFLPGLGREELENEVREMVA